MLRVITGPFHPVLEDTLVGDIRSLKAGDSLAPLALIVPSTALAEHVKRRLTLESRLSLLNVHCYTFHQLVLRLARELTTEPLHLVDEFYFRQLVRSVVDRKLTGLESLGSLSHSPGTWKGLWSTLRDLTEAAVDPSVALNAVEDGVFDAADRPWLVSLFTLYAAVTEAIRSIGVGAPDDLTASLSANLSCSSFLQRQMRVLYYGFYDLTQVQLSFVEAVIRLVPTTLYFPLEQGPAYHYARQFLDRHLRPFIQEHEDRSQTLLSSSRQVELTTFNAIGTDEELATVCRKILTLVEVNGYRFDDIGVVGRTLDGYQVRLQSVFDRHLVPFVSTAARPLVREPLTKILLQLASLPTNDFDRAAIMDVVTAPFYRPERDGRRARPDYWRSVVAALNITKGEGEWARLAASSAPAILEDTAKDPDAPEPQKPYGDQSQLTLLWSRVSRLIHDCRALPAQGSIGHLTDAFRALTTTHLLIPGLTMPDDVEGPDGTVGTLIDGALARLTQLDPLSGDVTWEQWFDLFTQILTDTALPIEDTPHRGVQVMDAMTARGLTFRALFVIGLNDNVFPRTVREDPFLRDHHRTILESTLGYKIDDKLSGHDEERLLFELLIRSATQRLCLSYQRADDAGRVMAPSAFLTLAARDHRFMVTPEETISRRLTMRIQALPSIQELLPEQELTLGRLLHGGEARSLYQAFGWNRQLLEHGLAALKTIERTSMELGLFDGLLTPRDPARPPVDAEGVSPTSLERYATCPFQYFAEKVLRLDTAQHTQESGLPALTMGTLVHDSLRRTYEGLGMLGWPDTPLTESDLRTTVITAVSEAFASHAATLGTGYALLWTIAREQVVNLVCEVASLDQEDYRKTGFRPYSFETTVKGTFRLHDTPPTSLRIRGKLDRVDVRSHPQAMRIVDYKFKQGSEMAAIDRNLRTAAVRGWRLQAPFYASMEVPGLPPASNVQFLYLGPRWEKPIVRETFESSTLDQPLGSSICHTIGTLVGGITRGEFFILPDGYCEHCAFPTACRRHDSMMWWRSYRSPQSRVLRQLRKQEVRDDE